MSKSDSHGFESDASSDEQANIWIYGVLAADRAEALTTVEGDR